MMYHKLLSNIKVCLSENNGSSLCNKNGKGSAVRLALYTGLW